MYPFTWQYIYIPVLPEQLHDYIHAPVPFIVGIYGPVPMDLPDDVVHVDLDRDFMRGSKNLVPPVFPSKERRKLMKTLRKYAIVPPQPRKPFQEMGQLYPYGLFAPSYNSIHSLLGSQDYSSSAESLNSSTPLTPLLLRMGSFTTNDNASTPLKSPGFFQKIFSFNSSNTPTSSSSNSASLPSPVNASRRGSKSSARTSTPTLSTPGPISNLSASLIINEVVLNQKDIPKDETVKLKETDSQSEISKSIEINKSTEINKSIDIQSTSSVMNSRDSMIPIINSLNGHHFKEIIIDSPTQNTKCGFCGLESKNIILECRECKVQIHDTCLSLQSIRPCPKLFNERVIQNAFFKVYLIVLKNYKQFLITETKDKTQPNEKHERKNELTDLIHSKGKSYIELTDVPDIWFDNKKYLDSLDIETKRFMSAVIETQAFSQFTLSRLIKSSINDYETLFIDESISELERKSKLFGKSNMGALFLKDAAFHVHSTFVCMTPLSVCGEFSVFDWPNEFDYNLFGESRSFPPLLTDADASLMRDHTAQLMQRSNISHKQSHEFGSWMKRLKISPFEQIATKILLSLDELSTHTVSSLTNEQVSNILDSLHKQHEFIIQATEKADNQNEMEQVDVILSRLINLITVYESVSNHNQSKIINNNGIEVGKEYPTELSNEYPQVNEEYPQLESNISNEYPQVNEAYPHNELRKTSEAYPTVELKFFKVEESKVNDNTTETFTKEVKRISYLQDKKVELYKPRSPTSEILDIYTERNNIINTEQTEMFNLEQNDINDLEQSDMFNTEHNESKDPEQSEPSSPINPQLTDKEFISSILGSMGKRKSKRPSKTSSKTSSIGSDDYEKIKSNHDLISIESMNELYDSESFDVIKSDHGESMSTCDVESFVHEIKSIDDLIIEEKNENEPIIHLIINQKSEKSVDEISPSIFEAMDEFDLELIVYKLVNDALNAAISELLGPVSTPQDTPIPETVSKRKKNRGAQFLNGALSNDSSLGDLLSEDNKSVKSSHDETISLQSIESTETQIETRKKSMLSFMQRKPSSNNDNQSIPNSKNKTHLSDLILNESSSSDDSLSIADFLNREPPPKNEPIINQPINDPQFEKDLELMEMYLNNSDKTSKKQSKKKRFPKLKTNFLSHSDLSNDQQSGKLNYDKKKKSNDLLRTLSMKSLLNLDDQTSHIKQTGSNAPNSPNALNTPNAPNAPVVILNNDTTSHQIMDSKYSIVSSGWDMAIENSISRINDSNLIIDSLSHRNSNASEYNRKNSLTFTQSRTRKSSVGIEGVVIKKSEKGTDKCVLSISGVVDGNEKNQGNVV